MTTVSLDEVNEDMRIEWSQCVACADRWQEEETLLHVRATLPPSTLFADRALLRRGYSISEPNALVETVSKYKVLH